MEGKGLFVSGKGVLLPHDERARGICHALKPGDKVLVKVHRPRNPEFNALAHVVFDRIGKAIGEPMEVVKLWIKWETGRVDLVKLPNGRHIASPRSLAFAAMTEDEFREFWNEAWPIISEKVLPNIPRADFEEIRQIVAGREIAA